MIEEIVVDYLNDNLEVPAFMEMPEVQPESFVLVERTGGSEEEHIQYATLAIQSYAESAYQAAVLNEMVKKAMKDIVILDSIFKSKLNSDYNFTDATKKKHRYQAVYDLVY